MPGVRHCFLARARGRKVTRPLEERFWPKVDKRCSDECWVWRGGRYSRGYGRFFLAGKSARAHRIAWQLANGEAVPAGMIVCHSCDNPPCVNPSHLWLGTGTDNYADMVQKGRHWQQRKTHCHRGHHLSPDNLFITSRGWRHCLTCKRANDRRNARRRYHEKGA